MSRWKHRSACSADHFARRPQARDDTATGGEDAAFSIDVLANDRGGCAKSLYSVDQDNPRHALTSTTLASGAIISIVDGQILYDPGSAFQFLDAGETATDTFTYAIRLGKGRISTATVTVTIEGADDQTGLSVERVSVSSAGEQGNADSLDPSLSADGRFVAYWSFASNLVEGDTNNTGDIFVFDRETGTTERVSVSSAGEQGNNSSLDPSLSADGRFVAYWSFASNLVEGDTNSVTDIFVFDRETGTTERVSVSSAGEQGNAEGDEVASSTDPSLSADGRFVAYSSLASNLVEGDTNNTGDIFVFDRETGTTERVSVSSAGEQENADSLEPSLSADGRFVAYWSYASNLVEGDTNNAPDIFVFDRETGTTERVSVSSAGEQGNDFSLDPSLSADGRFVAYWSYASNLVEGDTNNAPDIFVFDRETGTTERVSVSSAGEQGNADSLEPSLSADGRFVAYWSNASNLVEDDTNNAPGIFVFDRETGTTKRVSVSSAGEQGNNFSFEPSLSADGRSVAYSSFASNLVEGDTNNAPDIFVAATQDFLLV